MTNSAIHSDLAYLQHEILSYVSSLDLGSADETTHVWMDQTINEVINASSWEQREAARLRLLSLDPSRGRIAALTKLMAPQPAEVVDLLVECLAAWATIDEVASLAQNRNLPACLRAALAEVLGVHWENPPDPEIAQVGSHLCALVKDPDPAVRFAAVETLGAREVPGAEVVQVLRRAARDKSTAVSEEASKLLEELGV